MFISFVVCTYNREEYIGECIEAILSELKGREDAELVIVNNLSTDKTESIIKTLLQPGYNNVTYFIEHNQGLSYARNRGVKEAMGDFIVFLDDDAFVQKGYLDNLIRGITSNDLIAFGGKIIPKYESGEPRWMSKYLLPVVSAQDKGNQFSLFKGKHYPIGANMGASKEFIEKVGGFNVKLGRSGKNLEGGEEKDLFDKLRAHSDRIGYLPNVAVDHMVPDKRVTEEFVKRFAQSVGKSERIRIQDNPNKQLKKTLEEGVKVTGTIILFVINFLKLKPKAALMLVKFRYWVLKGLLTNQVN